jgi:hypothetical protein
MANDLVMQSFCRRSCLRSSIALLVSLITGVLGFFRRRAARMNPVDAEKRVKL